MTNWQPIETAPYGKIIEVRNSLMAEPVRATRGFIWCGEVHKDQTLFTSVYTGNLVCPTEWRDLADDALAGDSASQSARKADRQVEGYGL